MRAFSQVGRWLAVCGGLLKISVGKTLDPLLLNTFLVPRRVSPAATP